MRLLTACSLALILALARLPAPRAQETSRSISQLATAKRELRHVYSTLDISG